ncbi:MAG: RidA family protein, partial [Promethearchaeota archaeon]
MKKEIKAAGAPAAIGPYSQAVEIGNMIFLSGQIAVTNDGLMEVSDIEKQTRLVFTNIETILKEVGLTLGHVVKCQV